MPFSDRLLGVTAGLGGPNGRFDRAPAVNVRAFVVHQNIYIAHKLF